PHAPGPGEIPVSLRLGRCGQFLAYDLIHEFAVSTTLELRHDGAHHFAHVFRTARNGLAHGGTNLFRTETRGEKILESLDLSGLGGRQLGAARLLVYLNRLAALLDAAPQHLRRLVVGGSLVQLDFSIFDV